MIDRTHGNPALSEEDSRRVRLVMVPERDVLWLFAANGAAPVYLSIPIFNLPDGHEVLAVQYDYAHAAFAFKVRHPEFSPVELGTRIPVVGLTGPFDANTNTYRRVSADDAIVRRAVEAEREACATIAAGWPEGEFDTPHKPATDAIAAAIRARGL